MHIELVGLCVVFVLLWFSDFIGDVLSYKKRIAELEAESKKQTKQ